MSCAAFMATEGAGALDLMIDRDELLLDVVGLMQLM
jgi:hypothetical protein